MDHTDRTEIQNGVVARPVLPTGATRFVSLFVFFVFFRVEEKKKDNSIISTNLSDLNACRETFLKPGPPRTGDVCDPTLSGFFSFCVR